MSPSDSEKRDNLTSVEGMIWNANQVLTNALNPGMRGIPKGLFKSSAGICIMSTVQMGFVFSGSVGTGIFMKRNDDDTWSSPVAVGVTGIGFGIVLGINMKDVLLFLPDEASIQTMFQKGAELSAQTNLTAGVGREFDGALGASGSGTSAIISIAYSTGAFIGMSMQGAVVGPRPKANEAFYGAGNTDPAKIIDGQIPFPSEKHTLIDEVKAKLAKCARGETEVPGAADKAKADAALPHAEEAAAKVNSSSDVVHVNIEEEAAKEGSE